MELYKNAEDKILQPFLQHIIPFSFETKSENDIFDLSRKFTEGFFENEVSPNNKNKFSDKQLFEYIIDQIGIDCRSSYEDELSNYCQTSAILSHIAIDLRRMVFLDLTNKDNKPKEETDKKTGVTISLNCAELFLFKSGVGFLVLKISIDNLASICEFVELNSCLKGISLLKKYLIQRSYEEKYIVKSDDYLYEYDEVRGYTRSVDVNVSKITSFPKKVWLHKDFCEDKIGYVFHNGKHLIIKKNKTINYSYSDLILMLLRAIPKKYFFIGYKKKHTQFNEESLEIKNAENFPSKAIVYNSCNILLGSEDDIDKDIVKQELIRLSKGYTNKYATYQDDRLLAKYDQIYRPFKNVLWSFSREGVANLICHYEDNDTSSFLEGDIRNRFGGSYLLLYIISLHQYFGLLKLSNRISHLPYRIESYTKANQEDSEKNHSAILKLVNEIHFFHFKCVFEEVSHITHQAIFYSELRNVLGINNMLNELEFEMNKVNELIRDIRFEERKAHEKFMELEEKAKKQRELEKNKRFNFIVGGGGIITLFLVFERFQKVIEFTQIIEVLDLRFVSNDVLNSSLITVFAMVLIMAILASGIWIKDKLGKRKTGK